MTGTEPSRRTFLKAAAASGSLAVVGGAAAQETRTIELEAYIGGWEGVAPEEIAGETNPTLDLQPGQTYEVVWTNGDGIDHNFVVLNALGDQMIRSEVIGERGATQTVEFEATEEMAEYFCEVHPRAMRGRINIAEPQQRRDIPEGDSVGLQQVAEGLNAPLDFEVSPDGRRFVVDQTGQIYELTEDGLADEPFLDVSDRLVDLGIPKLYGYDERGLLGLAFHPDFQENGRFYVRYSAPLRDEVTPAGAAPVATDRISGEAVTGGPSMMEAATGNETAGNATAGNETADNVTAGNATGGNQTGNATAGNETEAHGKTGGPSGEYDHTDVLAEFQVADDGSADPDSERALWQLPSPQDNHNGGALAFGPDGYLYTTIGDGGAADDVGFGHVDDWYDGTDGGNGQDTTESLLGGIHRIDVDSGTSKTSRDGGGEAADAEGDDRPYGIPDDNPFADGQDGFPEYYAWGFRNPFRMSIDSDGRVFVGDAGQNRFEEVSMVERGGNYGWNVREATHCFSTENPSAPPEEVGDCPGSTPDDVRGGEELRDPVIEYPHRHFTTAFIDGSVAIGGFVYEGDAVEALQGQYVFGNWSGEGVVNPDGQVFVATEAGGDGGMAAGNETNATAGNETNVTAGNETMGNATGNQTATGAGGGDGLWSLEQLVIEGSEGGSLNRYVYAFGQDQDGELYVMTNLNFRPEGETGEVFRIVSAEEGEDIPTPEPAEAVQEVANETATNETAGNETMDTVTAENETTGNETMDDAAAGNETIGNETIGNETIGNETVGNETTGNATGDESISR
jgi:glucose/arabinose dehydrogenase